jgi:hypothetical protein
VLTNLDIKQGWKISIIHHCSICFDNKNVVVASSDAEIYSVVQGDMKTTNKKKKKLSPHLQMAP